MITKQTCFLTAFLSLLCISCKNEKLAIAGSGWQEIAIIDKQSGLIEWKHALEEGDECNDIEVTPEGNVLYAYSKGARLINRNHEIIWDYKAGENEEIHSASRLDDGNYLIGICGMPQARIVELDAAGAVAKELSFPTVIFDLHEQFRQIAKTDSDTYLVPLMAKRKVAIINPEGRYKGNIFTSYDMFSVKPLQNGNILISCGMNGFFEEVTHSEGKTTVLSITNAVKGAKMLYVAEIFLYKNGHKLIANSNMYSDDKSQPLLIEIDANDDVVWTLPFNREIKNITSVFSFYE